MLLFERSNAIILDSKFWIIAFAAIEVILLFARMILEKLLLSLITSARDMMYLSPYL